MIWLTRVDGRRLLVNEDHLVVVEQSHDTVLVMDTGERIRVVEPAEEISERAVQWQLRTSGASWLELERQEEGE
jgi:uncharacterized protein YlzI (FlbEa/FlbD family)